MTNTPLRNVASGRELRAIAAPFPPYTPHRRVASSRSTLSTPTPARPITFRFFPAAITSLVTRDPLRGRACGVWAQRRERCCTRRRDQHTGVAPQLRRAAVDARCVGARARTSVRRGRMSAFGSGAVEHAPAHDEPIVLPDHADQLIWLGCLVQRHQLVVALAQDVSAHALNGVRSQHAGGHRAARVQVAGTKPRRHGPAGKDMGACVDGALPRGCKSSKPPQRDGWITVARTWSPNQRRTTRATTTHTTTLQSVADRHTQAACGDTCVVHDGMESMGAWLGPQDSRKGRNRTQTIWSAVELQTA